METNDLLDGSVSFRVSWITFNYNLLWNLEVPDFRLKAMIMHLSWLLVWTFLHQIAKLLLIEFLYKFKNEDFWDEANLKPFRDMDKCLVSIGSKSERKAHIALIGDSRIRNFLEFFQFRFDNLKIQEKNKTFQNSLWQSKNVNLKVSFHWEPLIQESTTQVKIEF